jgi:hypothetical protein
MTSMPRQLEQPDWVGAFLIGAPQIGQALALELAALPKSNN